MNLLRYIGKRLAQTVLVLICVSIIAFGLIRIAPGDPATLLLPDNATEEAIAAKRTELGLDQPIVMQYLKYMQGVLKGDFGTSYNYQQPVLKIYFSRFWATLELTGAMMLICLGVGIPLGIIAGIHQGTGLDFVSMVFALIGQSMCNVWLAILNIYIFAVWLGWLPSVGMGGIEHIILPALTLGYPLSATTCRLGRSGMIDVLREDYITCTLAKGIPERLVYTKYAFKNALIPIVTIVGSQFGTFLGGSVVVECIFSWSGVGQMLNQAIGNRDYELVQGSLLLMAAMCALVFLLIDIINAAIDPRITLD